MKLLTFTGAKDYNKLHHLPFNRQFKVRKDLTDSMNERGFVVPITIIKTKLITGKEEMYIADGQNRAITAAFLDIKFYGILIEKQFKSITELVDFVSSLNSAHKAWTIDDYALSYAYLGLKPYVDLISIAQQTPYTISTIGTMLYGYRSRTGGANEKIKVGQFVINNLSHTQYTLSLCAELSKYEKLTSRMALALNYVSSLSNFNESKFIKEYQAKAKAIKELKLDDYTDVFQSWI